MRLISYKMSHDTGFAPNPFFGCLTLATCKPGIRRSGNRQVGDWIAGFGSKKMCRDEVVGNERLIYLMKVTEERLLIADYFNGFPGKKPIPPQNHQNIAGDVQRPRRGCGGNRQAAPDCTVTDLRYYCGDNIYEPLDNGDFEVLPNRFHPPDNPEYMEHDISGIYVLISRNFYYFGGGYKTDGTTGLFLPADARPNLAKGQTGFGTITEGATISLIDYIQKRFKPGIHGRPFHWPVNDNSWQNDENYIQP